MATRFLLLHILVVLCLLAATASRRYDGASLGPPPHHAASALTQAIDQEDQICSMQTDEAAKRPETNTQLPDHVFQDLRLILSFALGIAFMHFMEVMKPGRAGLSPQHKFELYPYVL